MAINLKILLLVGRLPSHLLCGGFFEQKNNRLNFGIKMNE